jgi:metallo-beta-lactamase family protein
MRLRAEVAVLNELSGHADQGDLLNWVRPIAPRLKQIFLVHGEPKAQQALAVILQEQLQCNVTCPSRGDSFELT